MVLLALTPRAMRLMLQVYEEYAKDHDMLFNADKSIISRPRGVASGGNLNHDIGFSIISEAIWMCRSAESATANEASRSQGRHAGMPSRQN